MHDRFCDEHYMDVYTIVYFWCHNLRNDARVDKSFIHSYILFNETWKRF